MKLKPYGYTTQAEWKKYLMDIRKRLNKQSKKTLIDFIIHLADNWHIFRESEKLRLYTLPKVDIKQKALPRLSSIDPSLHTPKARKAREARVNKAVRQLQQDEKKYRKTKRKTKKIIGKIYHTKNGQPYKILASGKARFVKR